MTHQLPTSEVIATAKQKLSSVSACLDDPIALRASVAEFDQWLSEHKNSISALTPEQSPERHEIEQLIHQLTRLELKARYNISLVADMQGYIIGQLENTTSPQSPYNR